MNFIGSILDRIFVLIGAFLGSQLPQFMEQYIQRLAAHIAELNHLIEKLRGIASLSNKTLEQYIGKFLNSSDSDFTLQGQFMEEMVSRWATLTSSWNQITQSSLWMKPYVFLREMNSSLVESTWKGFQPGISLTVEALCYTLLGAFFGFIIYQILLKMVLFIYRTFFPRKSNQAHD